MIRLAGLPRLSILPAHSYGRRPPLCGSGTARVRRAVINKADEAACALLYRDTGDERHLHCTLLGNCGRARAITLCYGKLGVEPNDVEQTVLMEMIRPACALTRRATPSSRPSRPIASGRKLYPSSSARRARCRWPPDRASRRDGCDGHDGGRRPGARTARNADPG